MRREMMLLAGLLAGCATAPTTVPVVVAPPAIALPTVTPLTLNPMQWQVLTVAELKALLANAQAQQSQVLFALDSANYQNFALNMVELRRYIAEQQAVITMLKAALQARSAPPSPDTH